MKLPKRRAVLVAMGIGLIVVVELWISAATRRPAVVTIASDTTYITRPLREDGHVDYVAALNEHASLGVTPENNSAVLFWAAMGPGAIDVKHRDEYFRMLGVPSLPEQGDYFATREEYTQGLADDPQPRVMPPATDGDDPISRQLDQAVERSWTEQEFPVLADWLAANERPLGLLIEASKRPRRYDAMISEDGTVMGMLLPAISQTRVAAEALIARAMLRAGDGKFDLAWADLLACHRLARLLGQGPTLVEALVADAIDHGTCAGDQGLLQSMRLTAPQAATMRADLAGLAAMPNMVDKIDTADRYTYLSGMLGILGELSSQAKAERFGMAKLTGSDPGRFDWDQILRMGNTWYDKLVAAGRTPTRADRIAAMQKVTDELEQRFSNKAKNGFTKAFSSLLNSRQASSEAMAFTMLSLTLPDLKTATDAEDRATMQLELVKLAGALAAYRADHDAYPENLSDLKPDYAAQVPQDIFSAAELRYARQGDGYVLYSVGVNGKDEDGKGLADQSDDAAAWDDQAVRVPAAAQ